jgi:hypothetical protein
MDIDIRTDGGLEMVPNSETEQGRYEWLGRGLLPISELPYGNIGWTRARVRKKRVEFGPCDGDARFRRAQGYARKILSISGEGGHNACYRAFCKCRAFGLTKDEALQLMLAWNETNARPTWSFAELLHKAESVYEAPHVR